MMGPTLYSILSFCLGCSVWWLPRHGFYSSKRRKRLEESGKLDRNLAEKYEAVVNNIREVIFQADSIGKIIYLNPSWEKLTGYGINEALGVNIQHYLYSEDSGGFPNPMPDKLENKEFYIITKDLKTSNNRID